MKLLFTYFSILTAYAVISIPHVVHALDTYVPLVGIPYVDTTKNNVSLADYVNGLYWAAISIAAVLAVLKIIFAGVQYTLADVITTKAQAKKDIQGALVGLIIVVAAVLILNTINPSIKNISALNLKPLQIHSGSYGIGTVEDQVQALCESDQNCVLKTCPVFRTSITCSSWCAAQEGIYIWHDWSTAAECAVPAKNADPTTPFINEDKVGSYACKATDFSEFGGQTNSGYDCKDAETQCKANGGTRWAQDIAQLVCFKPKTDTDYDLIGSEDIKCSDVYCTPEKKACTDKGWVVNAVRNSPYYYIVCKKP